MDNEYDKTMNYGSQTEKNHTHIPKCLPKHWNAHFEIDRYHSIQTSHNL